MIVRTGNIGECKRLGIPYLDITIGTGERAFAPTWDMVHDYKSGVLTESAYTAKYTNLMRRSYVRDRRHWDLVLEMDEVVLACYCKAGSFCHRYLLRDMLLKCGAVDGGEIGE
jgi:hypothetical protein